MTRARVLQAYLTERKTYWQCQFCKRAWRRKGVLTERQLGYLLDHIADHLTPIRRPASDFLELLPSANEITDER